MGNKIIYVEGKSDKSFIAHFLQQLPKNIKITNYEIRTTGENDEEGGKDRIKKVLRDFKLAKDEGDNVYIIFDADNDQEQKKFEKYLGNLKKEEAIDDYFFLQPQLEMFLLNSLGENDSLSCLKEYEKCVRKLKNNFQLSPKAKMYAYKEANYFPNFPEKLKKIDNEWDCFDYGDSYFNELKNFLAKIFPAAKV